MIESTPFYHVTSEHADHVTVSIDVGIGDHIAMIMGVGVPHTPLGDTLVRAAVDGWKATRDQVASGGTQ